MAIQAIEQLVNRSYDSFPTYRQMMPGVPEDYRDIKTLEQLLEINYKLAPVEEQLRGNLIMKMKAGREIYKGIIGYNGSVIPSVNRAILSGHEILFVGQIGQAKTKLAESIAIHLLSPIPIVRGSLTNDIPTSIPRQEMINLLGDRNPERTYPEFVVSPECERIIRDNKLETRIEWKEGQERYRYILATPDITVKDLVGQIDAIKIAKRGVELYNIESYSPGQLLQARYGVVCIDELPVLDSRKQVALLSVLQEGKFTTGSYPVIFRPNVKLLATANPVDYTHSGKIIEPLFDRLRSHIDTHYPTSTIDEMLIILQEASISKDRTIFLPVFILKAIARIAQLSREHPEIDHTKGVSVRMSIHSIEVLASEAERIRSAQSSLISVPRFSDFYCIYQTCKFQLSEIDDTRQSRAIILNSIIEGAIKDVSTDYMQDLSPDQLIKIKQDFEDNKLFIASQQNPGLSRKNGVDYVSQLEKFPNLNDLVTRTVNKIKGEHLTLVGLAAGLEIDVRMIELINNMDGEFTASVTELVLEGLRWTNPPLLDKVGNKYSARPE
ncbi:MAG: AAA family ATPase [Thermoproteota archaeon]|jgi:magnesium chelatase subunit I|nr:AAA family ATPase [Thermoproteota archaeon]